MAPDGSRWLQIAGLGWLAGLVRLGWLAGLAGLGWSGLAGLAGWAGLAGLAGLGWLGWPGWFCESSKIIVFDNVCKSHVSKILCFTMNTARNDIEIWSIENTAFLKRKNCGRANRNKTPTTRSPIRVAKNHFPAIGRSLTTI